MASYRLHDFIRRLCRARSVAESGHLSDGQLLDRFIGSRDEAAFEVLVWRHGTLVLNVARRLLGPVADVEDVFQATFLTLARKASAIRRGTSLSSWLYKVTYRIALRVRESSARHNRQMQFDLETVAAPAERSDAELGTVLAEEVDRLPERYRAVVVLCYLQGVTTAEAARLLGCPRGTVLSRLSSARQQLRQRLLRRRIAPAIALAAVSFGETTSAGPSVALVTSVVAAALPFAAGGAAVPMVSSQAAALAQGALQTMLWNKIKIGALIVCTIALAGTGSGWLARSRSETEASPPVAKPLAKRERLPELAPHLKEIDKLQKELAILRDKEQEADTRWSVAVIKARLELLERQEKMKWQEEVLELNGERIREKIKEKKRQIAKLDDIIGDFLEKTPKGEEYPSLTNTKKRKRAFEEEIKALEEELVVTSIHFQETKRDIRRKVIEAEVDLGLLENRHARQREEFASQRERMQLHLQRLEDKSLNLEPSDDLRDVERKLDALRREVGELRRVLERQGNDPPKKP